MCWFSSRAVSKNVYPQKQVTSVEVSLYPGLTSVSMCAHSRFHVVALKDGLDRQVAHAWVFGKVTLGPELVLQHLGKVPDILP